MNHLLGSTKRTRKLTIVKNNKMDEEGKNQKSKVTYVLDGSRKKLRSEDKDLRAIKAENLNVKLAGLKSPKSR